MVMWVGTGLHMVQYKLRGGELYNQVGVFRSDRTNEPEWGTPEELDERFSSTFETVQRGAALLDRSAHWKMFDREPIENWSRGRVTLMGDAAHPMLQYIAQGGCQALEDSIALARHLSGDLGVEDAFLAYQRERIPVTAQVQRTARRWGRISHVGRTAARLRNEVLRDRASNDFTALDWLYAGRQVGAAAPAGRDR
jgi:salicylate hydroxylase